jgi:hypothetical protein
MSIPLDRLYHYIESIAQEIYKDDIVIYRFYPHGAKKVDDLQRLREYEMLPYLTSPHIYCNDQEPLDYNHYQETGVGDNLDGFGKKMLVSLGFELANTNFHLRLTLFDKVLLLHSEERSLDVIKYQANVFIPVYYWCHAVIALDWFRYANHICQNKQISKKFLIYNRAWSGTREYRLKFVDLLIKYKLNTYCQITFNKIEPETKTHYDEHKFKNIAWQPVHQIENYFDSTTAASYASADFDLADYETTDFEVVLETLFDDGRLHLTEKALRPIAVGQPFLLVATHGSLAYLRRYGFKTFESVIDESYDTIEDPVARLDAMVKLMKEISEWSIDERDEKMLEINKIAQYNKDYFFSNKFFNVVIDELKDNLCTAFQEQEDTNTGRIIDWRKKLSKFPKSYDNLVGKSEGSQPRNEIAEYVKRARKYYDRR